MKRQNTDPIADFLTQLRNAVAVGKSKIVLPHSKLLEVLADLLKSKGFIMDYSVIEDGFKQLALVLSREGSPSAITGAERISKPGRRVYVKSADIPSVMGGKGLMIVSTSAQVMDGAAARKRGLGGELICKVW